MISSMTGFGRGSFKSRLGIFTAEVKTVNHKYLEVTCKLPNSLSIFEDKVKTLIQTIIKRGKVYYNLIHEGASPHADSLFVDKELAKKYYDKLSYLKKSLNLYGNIDVSDIISLPGILDYKNREKNISKCWPSIEKATASALNKLIVERDKEGKALFIDLKKRLVIINDHVLRIKDKSKKNVKGYKRKLEERIEEISGTQIVNNGRLEMEVALYAKNSDISEEVTRLKNHILNFERTINDSGEAGKKLDFIAQELHREINTVGSKSNDYAISKSVIEIKSEIEKIREQVKNLE